MNVKIEKVKVIKQTEPVVPDVKNEIKVEAKSEDPKLTILEKLNNALSKLMGDYDGKYQEEDLPGVPGAKPGHAEKKAEGDYDGKYQEEAEGEKKAEAEAEDCCPTCGAKSVKKAEKDHMEDHDEDHDEDEDHEEEMEEKMEEEEESKRKMEKSAEEVLPKKAEASAEKVDLSVEAWRANFFANSGVTPSKSMTDWQSACNAFANKPSKE